MKKFVSVLLALALVLSMTSAFATDSKGGPDIPSASVQPNPTPAPAPAAPSYPYTPSTTEEKESIVVEIVEDTEETAALKAKLAEAIQNGDLTAVFPEDVLSQIPEEYRSADNLADNIKEMVTVSMTGDDTDIESVTVTMLLDTPYEDGTEVYIALALINGENIDWLVKKGTVKDSMIEFTLNESEVHKLDNHTFALIVFSK